MSDGNHCCVRIWQRMQNKKTRNSRSLFLSWHVTLCLRSELNIVISKLDNWKYFFWWLYFSFETTFFYELIEWKLFFWKLFRWTLDTVTAVHPQRLSLNKFLRTHYIISPPLLPALYKKSLFIQRARKRLVECN